MNIDERYKYLRIMQPRYQRADRAMQKQLLDEMETVTGLHRKSLIRSLSGPLTRESRIRERELRHGPEVYAALVVIREALDYVCPERLTPSLVGTGKLLAQRTRVEPQSGGAAGGDQYLDSAPPLPVMHRRRKSRAPANRYQREIPAYRIARDVDDLGHLELDLVHHCGAVTEGEYVHTLQALDVATGWCA